MAHRSVQVHLLWTCFGPFTTSWKNNARLKFHIHWHRTCSSQSHVHKHNNSGPCLQCSCHGSDHFQLNVINKQIRIQASEGVGLTLINAITCSLTKQYTSIQSEPWALELLISNNNFMKKTMHISSPRSTGPGPAHILSQIHKQNNAGQGFQGSCVGPVHFQSHDIVNTIRIKASQAPGLDLFMSNYINNTKQCGSVLPSPLAWNCSFPTTCHKHTNTHPSLRIHWL